MATATFNHLPYEVIVLIASECEATSALKLLATSRNIRTACWDSSGRVFRKILLRSQREHWSKNTLDIDAIAQRCEGDPLAWARYAVADQKAFETVKALEQGFFKIPSNWAPELFVVKHPFMFHPSWRGIPYHTQNIPSKQGWCTALATLVNEEPEEQKTWLASYAAHEADTSTTGLAGCYAGLRYTVLELRRLVNLPYSQEIRVTAVPAMPNISQIDDALPNDPQNRLPLPFSEDRESWNLWHQRRNADLIEYLTTGVWEGHFMRFFVHERDPAARHDLPISNVEFRLFPGKDDGKRTVIAEDCHDGESTFSLRLNLTQYSTEAPTLSGSKYRYMNDDRTRLQHRGSLSLRLTPFGLIGFWSTKQWQSGVAAAYVKITRTGTVWLWRTTTSSQS